MGQVVEVAIGGNSYAGEYEVLEATLIVNYENSVNKMPINDFVKKPQALAKTILRKMVLEQSN